VEERYSTIGELAKQVGVDRWKLAYLIEKGKVPSPSAQVPGRRLFSPEDVEKIKNALEAMQEGAGSPRPPRGGQPTND